MDWHFWAWVLAAFWLGGLLGFCLFAVVAAGGGADEQPWAHRNGYQPGPGEACDPPRRESDVRPPRYSGMMGRPGGPWMFGKGGRR